MSSSNPLYYTGEKAKALITLPGLAQLAYDVNQRLTRQGNALYTINSTKDLTILIKLIPPSQCYGVLLQGNDGPHKTPIMIHNHRYYVLDSLGNAPSYGDIEKAIKNCYEKTLTPEVFYSNHMRQSDTFSCGSDALIIIEEALRIGSKLIDERLSKDEKYLHPALVKYTQGVARVKQINRKGVSPQTYSLLYPEELKKYYLDAITQRWYSIETYLEEHVSSNGKYNLAIDKYVLQHAEQLDAIAELPLPCQKTRAKSILPLDLLNKAPRKQLARLFLKEVSPLEWINESLGLKTQKEGILFIHNDRLNDPDYLIKKHKALNEQLKTLEHEYIIGSQEVTLLAISKLLYSLCYIEERMHQCAKEGMKNNVLSSEKKRLSTPFISNFFTRNKAPNHLPSAEKQTRKSHRRAASI